MNTTDPIYDDMRLLAEQTRTDTTAGHQAAQLAIAVETLLARVAKLTAECNCAHGHYVEATRGEWREFARANAAEAREAALLAQYAAEHEERQLLDEQLWRVRGVRQQRDGDGRSYVLTRDLLAALHTEADEPTAPLAVAS